MVGSMSLKRNKATTASKVGKNLETKKILRKFLLTLLWSSQQQVPFYNNDNELLVFLKVIWRHKAAGGIRIYVTSIEV